MSKVFGWHVGRVAVQVTSTSDAQQIVEKKSAAMPDADANTALETWRKSI